MTFKSGRLVDEFHTLQTKNKNLYLLLYALDFFCTAEFKKELEITSIYRTPEEDQAATAATKIHEFWKAADCSIHGFTDDEQARITKFCAQFTYRGTAGKPVSLIHAVPGGASHLHLQYF